MMAMKSDLVQTALHPIRLRILQQFQHNQQKTAHDLRQALPDVPQATLYRHLNKLVEANMIASVKQTKNRGAIEHTYQLVQESDPASMTSADMNRLFLSFLTNLYHDFQQYLQREEIDPVRDGISFRQAALYLTEEELLEVGQKVGAILQEAAQNKPGEGRTLRSWTTILLPKGSDET